MKVNREELEKEFSFRTSRSGGKGGQNVNKVSTKVELLWNFNASSLFTEEEKSKIALRLANRISNDEIFHVVAEEERTQLRNKEIAIKKEEDKIMNYMKDKYGNDIFDKIEFINTIGNFYNRNNEVV